MKTISKIPKTLKLIKENFKRYYKTNNSEYNIIIDETNEYYVEVLSVKSKYWYINLAQFLKNKKFDLLLGTNFSGFFKDACTKHTLIIKYWKDTNKVQVKTSCLEIRENKDKKLIYTKNKNHLFSLTEKGCYTIENDIILKLSINTVKKFFNIFRYNDCLLSELHPETIKFEDLTYLPSKFKNFKSSDAIIKHIDPENKGKDHSKSNLICLYQFLYKKDFNELLKYSNRMFANKSVINSIHNAYYYKTIQELNISETIFLYYMTRYPSLQHAPERKLITHLNNVFSINKKTKLIVFKKLKKYLFNRLKDKKEKINKNFKGNLCCNINGYKKLINSLFKPSFKFTWELLDSNKKVIDALNEACTNANFFRKSCFIKIYYKRSIIIFNVKTWGMYVKLPEDTILYTNENNQREAEIIRKIMSFIDQDISEQLSIKSKGRFGARKDLFMDETWR